MLETTTSTLVDEGRDILSSGVDWHFQYFRCFYHFIGGSGTVRGDYEGNGLYDCRVFMDYPLEALLDVADEKRR